MNAAAPLLRLHGIEGVSVDSVMAAASLTRGGFYAHFDSKESLVAEILDQDGGLIAMLGDRKGPTRIDLNRQAGRILTEYLDPANRHEVVQGCPLASLPIDAARASPRVRAAYGRRLVEFIRQLGLGLRKRRQSQADAIVIAVLAIGGVLLSRACEAEEDGDRIEAACIEQILRLLKE